MARRLYKEIMRSLERVDAETALGVRSAVREQFSLSAHVRDPAKIDVLLADGRTAFAEFKQFLQSNSSASQSDYTYDPAHDHAHEHSHDGVPCTHDNSHDGVACRDSHSGHEHEHHAHEHSHQGDALPSDFAAARQRAIDRRLRE